MNIARRKRRAGALSRVRPLVRATVIAALAASFGACTEIVGLNNRDLEILWPRRGAVLYDFETLRARVRGSRLDDYAIYWYVDDGRARRMWNERRDDPPHKAAVVDTWEWDWRGRGPYTVGFIAEDRRGREIAHRTVRVYVE